MKDSKTFPKISSRGSRFTLGLVLFVIAAGFLLLSEHQAHFLEALPWLILLACPLVHVFMHHDHGQGKKHNDE